MVGFLEKEIANSKEKKKEKKEYRKRFCGAGRRCCCILVELEKGPIAL